MNIPEFTSFTVLTIENTVDFINQIKDICVTGKFPGDISAGQDAMNSEHFIEGLQNINYLISAVKNIDQNEIALFLLSTKINTADIVQIKLSGLLVPLISSILKIKHLIYTLVPRDHQKLCMDLFINKYKGINTWLQTPTLSFTKLSHFWTLHVTNNHPHLNSCVK